MSLEHAQVETHLGPTVFVHHGDTGLQLGYHPIITHQLVLPVPPHGIAAPTASYSSGKIGGIGSFVS
jgi:hypothetical protein